MVDTNAIGASITWSNAALASWRLSIMQNRERRRGQPRAQICAILERTDNIPISARYTSKTKVQPML
jgi:hypothetical protein